MQQIVRNVVCVARNKHHSFYKSNAQSKLVLEFVEDTSRLQWFGGLLKRGSVENHEIKEKVDTKRGDNKKEHAEHIRQ